MRSTRSGSSARARTQGLLIASGLRSMCQGRKDGEGLGEMGGIKYDRSDYERSINTVAEPEAFEVPHERRGGTEADTTHGSLTTKVRKILGKNY